MKLFEVLDRHVEWKWIKDSEGYSEATFRIDRRIVEIMFAVEENPHSDDMDMGLRYEYIPEIVFTSRDEDEPASAATTDITNTGNEFEMFATVASIIQAWVAKRSPEAMMFSALTKEPSRVKLYKRFARVLSKRGYEIKYTGTSNGRVDWVMVKK